MAENNRIRVEMLVGTEKPKLHIPPQAARILLDSEFATPKPRSKTEINLRAGWLLYYEMGALKLDRARRFVASAQAVERLLERRLRMRLNCESWARKAPELADPRELYSPECFYPLTIC